jgi:hypothetical protein
VCSYSLVAFGQRRLLDAPEPPLQYDAGLLYVTQWR